MKYVGGGIILVDERDHIDQLLPHFRKVINSVELRSATRGKYLLNLRHLVKSLEIFATTERSAEQVLDAVDLAL